MTAQHFNVLFLCTGNSARSIFAEVLLNNLGRERFKAYSAGSYPAGAVNPYALRLLEGMGLPTAELRSKSWEEFSVAGAPRMDFVFTVCDRAAAEVCPIWPGQPMSAHWGVEDPATVEGGEQEKMKAFRAAFTALRGRISIFVNLPFNARSRARLQQRLDDIGRGRNGLPDAPG